MKACITNLIGYRNSANFKRAIVDTLPSCMLGFFNRHFINFIPSEFYYQSMIFIHVPKVAGTSISRTLFGRSVGHLPAQYLKKVDPNLWTSAYSFAVVRDPLDRLISAYFFLKSGGTKDVSVSNGRYYTQKDFETFPRFVSNWLKKNFDKIHKYDYVLWPQHKFVCDKYGKLLVDRIFRLENLNELEQELIKRDKINTSFPFSNRTIYRKKFNRRQLSKKTLNTIYELYEDDYRIFGYAPHI